MFVLPFGEEPMNVRSLNLSKQRLARESLFTVLDFETTGSVNGWPVEPWQIGVVVLENGRVSSRKFYESLIYVDRERPFNPMAPGRHARLRDELCTAPLPGELWSEISPLICGVPLVAHNTGTERNVLSNMAPLHCFGPWVDTLTLARRHYPEFESKALEAVVSALGLFHRVQHLCPGRDAHDALYDAFASAVLLEHFLALPGWEEVTLGALM